MNTETENKCYRELSKNKHIQYCQIVLKYLYLVKAFTADANNNIPKIPLGSDVSIVTTVMIEHINNGYSFNTLVEVLRGRFKVKQFSTTNLDVSRIENEYDENSKVYQVVREEKKNWGPEEHGYAKLNRTACENLIQLLIDNLE